MHYKFCAETVEKAAETNSENRGRGVMVVWCGWSASRGRGLLLCESYDSNYARMLTIIWILNDLITSGFWCVQYVCFDLDDDDDDTSYMEMGS